MSCRRGGGSTANLTVGEAVEDWAQINVYEPDGVFRPRSIGDLVAVVQEAEARSGFARAVGSVFSLSSVHVSDGYVIRTRDSLNRHLSRPFPWLITEPSLRYRSTAHDSNWLANITFRDRVRPGTVLVHVEAGIQIRMLLRDLASVGLAVPTMGSGGGQTLAGALSTGTHGADVELPPLSDAVRAVHLVGPAGREWWIEDSLGLGDSAQLQRLPQWCPDTVVVRDSDFLDAAMVGVGRFGVIYSMVLEVVPQYRLEEVRESRSWPSERIELLDSVANGYDSPGGIFDAPRTGSQMRHFQLVIDIADGRQAWLTRRWLTESSDGDVGFDRGFDATGFACRSPAVLAAALPVIQATVIAIGSVIAKIPFYGIFDAPPYFGFAASLGPLLATSRTVGEFVARAVELARGLDLDWIVKELSSAALAGEHDPPLRRGPSHRILDTHNYELDGCFSVNSAEYFFDAEDERYIQFVSDVNRAARELGPLPGVISLRFVRRSKAKIAMERFGRTVAIEVGVMRPSRRNREFMRRTEKLARAHGGLPHWGQEHDLDAADTNRLYGEALETWRWAVAETEFERAGTFSNAFTRRRGLEPVRSLDLYRADRYAATIVAGTV